MELKGDEYMSAYTRKIRFESFYVSYKCKTDNDDDLDRAFDLRLWIKKSGKLSLEARTFDYYQEQARLDKMGYGDKSGYWYLNFVRLRETNIPSKVTIDKEAEPIELDDDEYIGEDSTALYDENNHILMLQRNRYSLGPNGIEEYLNLLYDDENIDIFLRPIRPQNIKEKIKKAKYYRRLVIRFSDIRNENYKSSESSSIKNMIKTFCKYDAVNAEIVISMGNTRKDTLSRETVYDTLQEVYKNKNIISKAELTQKDTDDTNVEVIDLFEDKLHDFIYFHLDRKQTLSCEYVSEEMKNKYNDKKGEVIKSLGEEA